MGSVNRVILMGNLTRKPELHQTQTGTPVTDLGVAVSDKYKSKTGELVEVTCFADVVVWGKQAEMCEQYLNKGAPVLVEGRLQYDQWQTDSGEKKSRLRVKADRVQFLGKLAAGKGATEGVPVEPAVAGVAETSEVGGEMPF